MKYIQYIILGIIVIAIYGGMMLVADVSGAKFGEGNFDETKIIQDRIDRLDLLIRTHDYTIPAEEQENRLVDMAVEIGFLVHYEKSPVFGPRISELLPQAHDILAMGVITPPEISIQNEQEETIFEFYPDEPKFRFSLTEWRCSLTDMTDVVECTRG